MTWGFKLGVPGMSAEDGGDFSPNILAGGGAKGLDAEGVPVVGGEVAPKRPPDGGLKGLTAGTEEEDD